MKQDKVNNAKIIIVFVLITMAIFVSLPLIISNWPSKNPNTKAAAEVLKSPFPGQSTNDEIPIENKTDNAKPAGR